jgi:hypothetical protein
MDETAGKALKRRGLMAGAAALVAGIAAQRASQPVGATSGGGPDGPLVMGSNFGSGGTPNTISRLTVQVPTGTWSGSTAAMVGVDAVVAGNAPADTTALYGVGKGGGAGLLGSAGVTPANVTALNAGVYGIGSGGKTGVRGASDTGIGVYGSSARSFGGWFEAGSDQGSGGVVGVARVAGTVGFQALALSPATTAGFFSGSVSVIGSLGVTGGKFAVVKGKDGQYRGMYAVESPECWFEDAGTGTIANGKADVKFDADFAQFVKTDDYHVFITEHGQNNGLHIASRSAAGFSVAPDGDTLRAKGKAAADVNGTFSYRVMAKRADIKGERLPVWQMPPAPHLPDAPRISPDTIIGGPAPKDSAPDGTGPLPAPPSRPAPPSASPQRGAPSPVPAPSAPVAVPDGRP